MREPYFADMVLPVDTPMQLTAVQLVLVENV